MSSIELDILPDRLAICRLAPSEPFCKWDLPPTFCSITRTEDELSVVIPESFVPPVWKAEKGWRCFKVRGPLDFSLTGILYTISAPLASAGISLFAISTFDTDYILVKQSDLQNAVQAFRNSAIGVHGEI